MVAVPWWVTTVLEDNTDSWNEKLIGIVGWMDACMHGWRDGLMDVSGKSFGNLQT